MKPYLIVCALCGGKMSSVAISCPHCGNPNDTIDKNTDAEEKMPRNAKYKKRTDGRYETVMSSGKYDEETGKLVKVHVYARTKTEFDKKKAEIKTNISKGIYANDKGYTVSEWAKEWVEIYKKNNYGYCNIIKNHFSYINDYKIKDLTKSAIQKQINSEDGHYDIQRRIKMTINQMLECAIEDGLLYRNVCRDVKLPKKPKSDKRVLTDSEIKAIKNIQFENKERAFILCLYNLGIRRGEALALRKDSFDFKKNMVHISNAVSFETNTPIWGNPKTFSGDRYIDLIEPFKSEIKRYIESCNGIYLFSNSNGNLMSKTSLRHFWNSIYRKINEECGGKQHYDWKKTKKWIIDIDAISGLTMHVFRHNYITNLYYAGVDIKEAQRLAGHADAKTTIEIYTHLDKEKSHSTEKIQKYYTAVNI